MTKYTYPTLDYREHRRCNCGKLMIRRMSTEIDNVIDGMPVKEWTWWCNCGNRETGGMLKGVPETTWVKKEWERVNNIEKESK